MSLTQKRLKEVMSYDPATGKFVWLINRTNGVKAGDVVGCLDSKGYLVTAVDGKRHQLHRLAFLYMNGEFPPALVDHLNRTPSDNRWINIRAADYSTNGQNRKLDARNSSGVTGVKQNNRGSWTATAGHKGKVHFLGQYSDFFEAVCARKSGENKIWRNV